MADVHTSMATTTGGDGGRPADETGRASSGNDERRDGTSAATASPPIAREEGFLPLRGYAVLGDGRSCVLVAADGAVDWWALPTMDAAPSFGAILAPHSGGRLTLRPVEDFEVGRGYLDDGGVLRTVFRTATGSVAVSDALTMAEGGQMLPWSELARRVQALDGTVPMRWEVVPGDRFATSAWRAHQRPGGPALIIAGGQQLALVCQGVGQPGAVRGGFAGEFTACPGEPGLLAVVCTEAEPLPVPPPRAVQRRIDHTAHYWRDWCAGLPYQGRWQAAVRRSAVVLKQLTFTPTGAIQGAGTTSLPEAIGGSRNMDYRFSWVRDSGFALTALSSLDLRVEVHAALSFLLRAAHRSAPDLPPFYTLRGEKASPEMVEIDSWSGYRNSAPVHVGNGAADQRQLGSYGDALEAISRYVAHGNVLDDGSGRLVARLAEQVCAQWREPDAGIWELGEARPYTSSKIGCWAALTRAAQLADAGQVPGEGRQRWRAVAEQIRDYINQLCWSPSKRSYTFYAGSDELDCAALLVARTGFCEPDDPRLHDTINAVRAELSAGGSLLYRYTGMSNSEGAFLTCSFWLVEALVHAGRLDEAAGVMDGAVAVANDVGLLTEEIDPHSGELLSNMPQALSHLSLINAAVAFTRAQRASCSG